MVCLKKIRYKINTSVELPIAFQLKKACNLDRKNGQIVAKLQTCKKISCSEKLAFDYMLFVRSLQLLKKADFSGKQNYFFSGKLTQRECSSLHNFVIEHLLKPIQIVDL